MTVTSGLRAQHPDFLRLFYLLSMERTDDPAVAELTAGLHVGLLIVAVAGVLVMTLAGAAGGR